MSQEVKAKKRKRKRSAHCVLLCFCVVSLLRACNNHLCVCVICVCRRGGRQTATSINVSTHAVFKPNSIFQHTPCRRAAWQRALERRRPPQRGVISVCSAVLPESHWNSVVFPVKRKKQQQQNKVGQLGGCWWCWASRHWDHYWSKYTALVLDAGNLHFSLFCCTSTNWEERKKKKKKPSVFINRAALCNRSPSQPAPLKIKKRCSAINHSFQVRTAEKRPSRQKWSSRVWSRMDVFTLACF